MNQLDQLKKITRVVADTGELEAIAKYHPQDATTNPSLILKACAMPQYQDLVQSAVSWVKKRGAAPEEQAAWAVKKLLVNFGVKILEQIPGRVSTEIDARLSFDAASSIHQAQELIALYQEAGVGRERILIKIASTWEGIEAASVLEKQGIHCNLTLLFELAQAIACAEAGATLISPFVGRIYDWHRKNDSRDFSPEEDPGVLSVIKIYDYLHHFGYATTVMGASFRHIGQIRALAGCDCLTISPALLEELQNSTEPLPRRLDPDLARQKSLQKLSLDEKTFRFLMNENAMATEKLAEGIRLFSRDIIQLESLIQPYF